MKVKIIALFLIMLLIPVFFFVDETQAKTGNWDPPNDVFIDVIINKGTKPIEKFLVYEYIEETLDNYRWIVNNTEYVFTTKLININDVLNNVLDPEIYEVYIYDGGGW